MPLPLVPLVVLGLAGTAAYKVHKRKRGMTPERQALFEGALKSLPDPDKLRSLADKFHGEGFPLQADLLRKRATLRELPEDVQEKRREVFRKGMASTDADKVELLSKVFEKEGCTGAGACLQLYASGLRASDPNEVEAIAKSLETKKGKVAKMAGEFLRVFKNGT
jgi:hypothetical protein